MEESGFCKGQWECAVEGEREADGLEKYECGSGNEENWKAICYCMGLS